MGSISAVDLDGLHGHGVKRPVWHVAKLTERPSMKHKITITDVPGVEADEAVQRGVVAETAERLEQPPRMLLNLFQPPRRLQSHLSQRHLSPIHPHEERGEDKVTSTKFNKLGLTERDEWNGCRSKNEERYKTRVFKSRTFWLNPELAGPSARHPTQAPVTRARRHHASQARPKTWAPFLLSISAVCTATV